MQAKYQMGSKKQTARKMNNCALPGKNRKIYIFYFILPNSNAVAHM